MTSRPCRRFSILLPALAALAAPSYAQTEPASEPPAAAAPASESDSAIAEPLRAKIVEVLRLTDSAELGRQMMDQMLGSFEGSSPGVPEEFWTRLRDEFQAHDLVELIVPIYARHLTEAELDALIAFYSSEHGRSIVKKMPQVMQESMSAGQQWGADIARQVMERLEASGFRQQG
jgi:hypothetical protein